MHPETYRSVEEARRQGARIGIAEDLAKADASNRTADAVDRIAHFAQEINLNLRIAVSMFEDPLKFVAWQRHCEKVAANLSAADIEHESKTAAAKFNEMTNAELAS